LGRISFTSKLKPAKAEPVIDWFEIESRLQEISVPARASADLSNLAIEPSATLAHDPAVADDPEIRDQPMNNSTIRSWCLAGSRPIQTQNVFITILRHCKPGTHGPTSNNAEI